ncbi:MAG: DUF58 domain-containing protein, partial [Lachnospiraceae bacterium]|nr:DUF58 domain-containing protein [Lachnospiraceae bacterium]
MLRNRMILLALWVLSLVGISFYGGPIAYGFFAVMTLIPVVCLVYLLLVLARFKIYQNFVSPEIVSNKKTPFYFTLNNEDRFAFCAVRVNFYSDFSVIDGLSDDIEYELLPQNRIKKETGLVCRYRGEYKVGIRSVTLRDFLCIFRLTYNNPEPLRVKVLPDTVRLSALRHVDIDLVSERETNTDHTYPDALVRDYVPGDDRRYINWKQTARVGFPMVRKFVGEEKTGIGLIIDPVRIHKEENLYLPVENRILEIAIALTLFMEERRVPVSIYGLGADDSELVVDKPSAFNEFYERATAFSFKDDADRSGVFAGFLGARGIFDKKMVFLVTGKLDDNVMDFCKELNKNDTEAFVY